MKTLPRTQFGDPILRERARKLRNEEILSKETKELIADMRNTLVEKKLGIGLASPQVGKGLALAVIAIRPSEMRPNAESYDLVIINPEVTATKGNRVQVWEGCISAGSHGKADLFAKVPRYKEITLKYLDEEGEERTEAFTGLKAQVIQHETDHLNGVLFVDRVKDTTTYMTHKEYLKAHKKRASKKSR